MPSLRTVVAASIIAVASADYSIDPESVPLGVRQSWCKDELNQCPLICQQVEPRTTKVNTCDPKTLNYGCLCGNNQQPNITEFSLTMPYFICTEWVTQCQKACTGNNNACQAKCTEQNRCGAKNPTRVNKTDKASASATTDLTTIYTNSINSPGGSKGAATALDVGRSYGLAVVFFSMFAGFAML